MTADDRPMLAVEGLSKSFGGVAAMANVTLDFALSESVDSRYVNGIVTAISQGAWDREKDITLYTLEIHPQLWELTRNVQSAH